MTDVNGVKHLDQVNNIEYKDKLHCLADKAFHSKDSMIESEDKETKVIRFICVNKKSYIN